MTKALSAFALLIIVALGLEARGDKTWPSARELGLKRKVQILVSSCSGIDGSHETRYTYEFGRSGKLMKMTSPNFKKFDCIVSLPLSHKVTKRNGKGEIEEGAWFIEGILVEKEKYEFEYDAIGNWVKRVTFLMRLYEREGGDWKAGEWKAVELCTRTIEYYP